MNVSAWLPAAGVIDTPPASATVETDKNVASATIDAPSFRPKILFLR
jgi:hypothetical protein